MAYGAPDLAQVVVRSRNHSVSGNQGDSSALGQPVGRRKKKYSALSILSSRYSSFKLDSRSVIDEVLLRFGLTPLMSLKNLLSHFIDFGYISLTRQIYLDSDGDFLSDHRRRLRIICPLAAYHIQTSSLSRRLNVYPIIPCQSKIFGLRLDGNVEAVKTWFKNGWVVPSVTNQHGENLLLVGACLVIIEHC
jgi:hypothetical protein